MVDKPTTMLGSTHRAFDCFVNTKDCRFPLGVFTLLLLHQADLWIFLIRKLLTWIYAGIARNS